MKPVVYEGFWERLREMVPKKEPKSITFVNKTDTGFRQAEKPKTNGKLMIMRAPFW